MTAAVVVAAGEPTVDAARAQTVPVTVHRAATLAQALTFDSGRLWLLGPGAVPAPDALERLLAAAGDLGTPEVALLASLPVDAAGAMVEAALPRGDEAGTERLLAAVGRGLVPVKLAPLTSLLVDAGAARSAPAPEPERFGPFAALAWTGRLLRDAPGYLVLASRVQVPAPARPGLGALPAVRQMRRAGLWTRGETLRTAAALTPFA